jgi:hypothetical protein
MLRQKMVYLAFMVDALVIAGGRAEADESIAAPAPRTLSIEGGIGTASFAVEAELKTGFGLVIGGGPGGARGAFSVGGHIGYQLPFGASDARWSLRPEARFSRLWMKTADCSPPSCTYDFVVLEMAAHYQGPSGFVFEVGLPVVAWLPVGPDAGETKTHLKAFTYPDTAFFTSVLLGYAVAF